MCWQGTHNEGGDEIRQMSLCNARTITVLYGDKSDDVHEDGDVMMRKGTFSSSVASRLDRAYAVLLTITYCTYVYHTRCPTST